MSMSNTHRELRERELLSRPVAGLQYMLGKLAGDDPELIHVAVDGVFGERTLEAVLRFQKKAGLPMTGRADPDTWEALRARWRELEGRAGPTRPVRVFPAEGTRVEAGTVREYLILPQTMFRVLARQFAGIADLPADGVHTAAWEDNVRWLQRAGGLPPTGTLDQPAWDALSRLYEVFVVRERERDGFDGGWG